ncbi:CoA-binding protein [Oerskovia flava]|uniref:CoA-binding protein n=1 Tax=Oerskovia flava TaxID=2986422 RepID=UPI00223F863D|nr:CoA-binding protein [Oerskovia sp. JB1-3-2]
MSYDTLPTPGTDAQPLTSDETIRRVLDGSTTWAVVGLSNNTSRAAYGVARLLQQQGKRIVPVHPRAETVHGEQGYASLADVPFPVDVVDVFVRSELAGAVADEALAVGAKAVWFQLGVIDADAAARVRAAGADMVVDRCPAIEWPRLGPGAPARSSGGTRAEGAA